MANFYISDLHIGHENILRFDNRPFADVNEMNNKLIENWNARVRSDDTVYILGDFIWAKESEWPSIVGSLAGNKVLIRGNHDPKLQRRHKAHVSGNHGFEGNQGQRQACCDVSLANPILPCRFCPNCVHALRSCPSDD